MIDLSMWDYSEPFLSTPRRGESVYLYLAAIDSFIMGSGGDPVLAKIMGKKNITHYHSRAAALAEFAGIIRQRIDAPLYQISIFVRACMARDPEMGDYNLPRANEPWAFTNADLCLSNRCLSTALTYRVQDEVLLDGDWYGDEERMVGFTDAILYNGSEV